MILPDLISMGTSHEDMPKIVHAIKELRTGKLIDPIKFVDNFLKGELKDRAAAARALKRILEEEWTNQPEAVRKAARDYIDTLLAGTAAPEAKKPEPKKDTKDNKKGTKVTPGIG